MLLVIDAGNTTTELGIFDQDQLIGTFRYITKIKRTSDELGIMYQNFLAMKKLVFSDFDAVIISSVVPDINYTLTSVIVKYFNVTPMMVGPGIKTGIRVQTENPKEVGADRIVDALAAYELYGGPIIVVNFGTATRFDYVTEDGIFGIAVTSPGIQISADALWYQAAKLPKIEIEKPKSILASNTVTSMQAGLVYGYIGLVEYILKEMQRELGIDHIKTVACGGYAKIIIPNTQSIEIYDPMLTIKGLKLLYDKNKH
jgi:type III pantothenate kinase